MKDILKDILKDIPWIVRVALAGLVVLLVIEILPGKSPEVSKAVAVVNEDEMQKSLCRSYGGIPRPGMRFGCSFDWLYGGCDFPPKP